MRYQLWGILCLFFLSCNNNDAPKINPTSEKSSSRPKTSNLEKPNILIILTDDQGYHDVSYYGTKDLSTPHIDALVQDGMRFDNFYANCTVCSPTRAALLSGRYQDRVGVPGVVRTMENNNWGYLDPETVLLPQQLKDVGYNTALIGKWHLGLETPNIPTKRGFDFFKGWLGDMMDDYWKKRRHDINYMRLNDSIIDPPGHATDLFTEWSVDYIEQQVNSESPFFLYLAYNAPHFPVQPPKEWLERVQKRFPNMDNTRASLVAFIEHLDDGIGKVINTLKETGQYDNTLIVFTSDNGGWLWDMANNGPYRGGKTDMYEGGLRVPAGITWKNQIPSGTSSNQINLTMDLFPTILEAAGVSNSTNIEGRSFLATLKGQSIPQEERPIYFTWREGMSMDGKSKYALRYGDWKLVQNSPYAPMELFNLKNDPKETTDLSKIQKETYQELNELLMLHIQEGGKVPWQKPDKQETEKIGGNAN